MIEDWKKWQRKEMAKNYTKIVKWWSSNSMAFEIITYILKWDKTICRIVRFSWYLLKSNIKNYDLKENQINLVESWSNNWLFVSLATLQITSTDGKDIRVQEKSRGMSQG